MFAEVTLDDVQKVSVVLIPVLMLVQSYFFNRKLEAYKEEVKNRNVEFEVRYKKGQESFVAALDKLMPKMFAVWMYLELYLDAVRGRNDEEFRKALRRQVDSVDEFTETMKTCRQYLPPDIVVIVEAFARHAFAIFQKERDLAAATVTDRDAADRLLAELKRTHGAEMKRLVDQCTARFQEVLGYPTFLKK